MHVWATKGRRGSAGSLRRNTRPCLTYLGHTGEIPQTGSSATMHNRQRNQCPGCLHVASHAFVFSCPRPVTEIPVSSGGILRTQTQQVTRKHGPPHSLIVSVTPQAPTLAHLEHDTPKAHSSTAHNFPTYIYNSAKKNLRSNLHKPTWPGGYHFGLGGNRSAVRPLMDALSMVATGLLRSVFLNPRPSAYLFTFFSLLF